MYGRPDYSEDAPLSMAGGSRQSFLGPSDGCLASGWVEQLRRSKMQKVWKPVRLSLTQNDMTLWVQRDNSYGRTETLQRIPLLAVRSIGLVDEYMGERRFCLMVPDNLDDPQVMFRCDQPAAANKWITALRTAQDRAKHPNRMPPAEQTPRPAAPPPPKVTPPPAPPPQDLLSFHVVAPSPVAPPPQTPSPPRPLGAADFDPLRAAGGRPAPAPVSAPAPPVEYAAAVPPPHHHPHHQAAPHSAGVPWSQLQQQQQYRPHPAHQPPHYPPHPAAAHAQQQQAAMRQAVLNTWALKPPHRQELRTLDQLVTTVQNTFTLTGQPVPPYFQTWVPVSYNDLCTHHVLDAALVDKAVRKLRCFLHPDKWPADLTPAAQGLCRLLWEILQNAQQQQERQGAPPRAY